MLSFKNLKKLPVETLSGVTLGKIIDLELNGSPLRLTALIVSTTRLNFFRVAKNSLLIAPEQIQKILPTKIIVDDTLTPISVHAESEERALPAEETFALNSELE